MQNGTYVWMFFYVYTNKKKWQNAIWKEHTPLSQSSHHYQHFPRRLPKTPSKGGRWIGIILLCLLWLCVIPPPLLPPFAAVLISQLRTTSSLNLKTLSFLYNTLLFYTWAISLKNIRIILQGECFSEKFNFRFFVQIYNIKCMYTVA